MSEHVLDQNTNESNYFERLSKNGKAAYRHAVYTLTGDLPIWAKGLRTVYTKRDDKVYTQPVYTPETKVTTLSAYEEERNQPGWVDPLTLLP